MTEVDYSAELVADVLFQNVEGGEVHIVGARFDHDRQAVVFSVVGSAIPKPAKVKAIVRQESREGAHKFFTRFEPTS